jgi:hypothetical protein
MACQWLQLPEMFQAAPAAHRSSRAGDLVGQHMSKQKNGVRKGTPKVALEADAPSNKLPADLKQAYPVATQETLDRIWRILESCRIKDDPPKKHGRSR